MQDMAIGGRRQNMAAKNIAHPPTAVMICGIEPTNRLRAGIAWHMSFA